MRWSLDFRAGFIKLYKKQYVPMKAIVVDDEPSNLEILQLTLELIGLEVHAFSDGRNLVPKAREIVPSIILLDIDLGEYDGRELCKVIKSTYDLCNTPIMILSATNESKLLSAKDYGADTVIAKPFDVDELIAEVEKLINK